MINYILTAIRNELNDFIKVKDPTNFGNLDIVVLSSLVDQNGELAFTTNNNNQTVHKIVITLVNVEEERILKEQNYFKKALDDSIINLNPEIRINLSVLFTAYSTSYESSLRILSYLLGFFQMKNVFTPQNTPELAGFIEKATIELQTLSAEQNNHLWGYLGAKYIPSVVYRIKMLVIQEGQKKMEGPPITTISENFEDRTNKA
jgi:hypothetical protein